MKVYLCHISFNTGRGLSYFSLKPCFMFATNNEPRHENVNNISFPNPIHCVLSDRDLLNNSLHVRTGSFLECDITMVKYLLSDYE